MTLEQWIAQLYRNKDMTRMGHLQRESDLNLGLGWIYYGIARTIRPRIAVVIGSYRGFVPLVLGRALADNQEGGEVVFIDPSLVDDFWKDAESVKHHFARHGVNNIRHYLMTTQEFAASDAYGRLPPVGLLFIDGYHSEEQARFDYETFENRLERGGMTLFHDTAGDQLSRLYGRERSYPHRVTDYVARLKRDATLQVFDMPFGRGVTIVRKLDEAATGEAEMPAEAGAGAR